MRPYLRQTHNGGGTIIDLGAMKDGQGGAIVGGQYDGHVALKSKYGAVFDFTNGKYWGFGTGNAKIRVFPAGTVMSIELK